MILSSGDTNCKEKIKIHDKGLFHLINGVYKTFKTPFKTRYKKCIAVYSGDLEDMKALFIMELQRLFDDSKFMPSEESAIFKKLKYNVVKHLNNELENEPVTKGLYIRGVDGEIFEITPGSVNPFEKSPGAGYSGINKKILRVIKNVDITKLCQKNSFVQLNIANLIKKYYFEEDGKLPSLNTMLSYYKKEYCCEITASEYSRALNNLFKLICNNVTELKGSDINRRDYISSSHVNQKIEYCYNTDKTLKLIKIVNELEGYIPESVTGDEFYRIVKTDSIKQICYKNKAVIKYIDDLDNLSLDDYTDLLEAVYYMLRDYCREKIDYQLKAFINKYKNYTIDTNIYDILQMAMGKPKDNKFWSVVHKKNGIHIMRFNKTDGNIYTALKGKSEIIVSMIKRICRIGNCKFIVADNGNIYCRSADKELINLKRIKNSYSASLLAA